MRRRSFVPLIAVPVLLLALAAPVAAAPPMRESGTQQSLFERRHVLFGVHLHGHGRWMPSPSTPRHSSCASARSRTTPARAASVSQESGCTETSPGALTVTGDFTATLAPTTITFASCDRRGCTEGRTVTVSAQDSAVGPVFTETGRGTFSDGACTSRYSFASQSAQVAGTLTVDGATQQQSGFAGISQFKVTTRCG